VSTCAVENNGVSNKSVNNFFIIN